MDLLKDIFAYSETAPLLFTKFYFWAFFALVLFIYSFLHKQRTTRSAYLFLISLFFYYKSSGLFFSILLFSTCIDYFIGNAIYAANSKQVKKWLLGMSVALNLGLLCYFKYAYFFTENYNALFNADLTIFNHFAHWTNSATGSHFEVSQILLPVGISFFTFQTISYSVDIYREKIKPVKNILDFGFYVSFFPQLVAGPIVRAADFIPQIYQDYKLSKEQFGQAIFLILNGLTKKLLIGDYIAVNFVDRVFDNPAVYSGFENLAAVFGYSLQIYCDFSGYTDIAIGVALLMGFHLNTNFNSPYKAVNVGEFWKRWHMSLSSWLKDYLYVPLGGNKKGKIRTNFNLMITMLLGGLWHGASWQFVIWGALNGVGLIIYKYWKKISPYEKSNLLIVHFWKVLFTFSFISFTRIWFRSDTMETANMILYKIGNDFNFTLIPQMVYSYKYIFGMMALGFIVHWLPTNVKDIYRHWFINTPVYAKAAITAGAVFILYQSISSDLQPFIYFQF